MLEEQSRLGARTRDGRPSLALYACRLPWLRVDKQRAGALSGSNQEPGHIRRLVQRCGQYKLPAPFLSMYAEW